MRSKYAKRIIVILLAVTLVTMEISLYIGGIASTVVESFQDNFGKGEAEETIPEELRATYTDGYEVDYKTLQEVQDSLKRVAANRQHYYEVILGFVRSPPWHRKRIQRVHYGQSFGYCYGRKSRN